MPFKRFLEISGVDVLIERNGTVLRTVKGLFNSTKDTHRKYCGFLPDTDIKPNDWIIRAATGERFYIVDTESQSFKGELSSIDAFYQTEVEHKNSNTNTNQSVFNIQNAYGSVIGSGNTATINYNNSIQEIKNAIAESESADKEELKQIVTLLEMIVNNQIPASKGLFSRFSEVMERNSWITGSIAGSLLSWLMTQIP